MVDRPARTAKCAGRQAATGAELAPRRPGPRRRSGL